MLFPMRSGLAYAFLFMALFMAAVASRQLSQHMPAGTIPTGRRIAQHGRQTSVGSFPCNMVLSKSGRFLIVTNSGFRQNLSVLDAKDGHVVSQQGFQPTGPGGHHGLYFGLACHSTGGDTELLAVSHGQEDAVSIYKLGSKGSLAFQKDVQLPRTTNPLKIPNFVAGVAWSEDGSKLYAVANQSHVFTDFKGSLLTFDPATGALVSRAPLGSFPLDVAVLPGGDLCVTNEGNSGVTFLDANGRPKRELKTGEQPSYECVDHSRKNLYVSNSNSDTVSQIDTMSGVVKRTILVRPAAMRDLPCATPLGLSLAPDDRTLFVALGDLNAVGVVDTHSGRIRGYMPAGWYPTGTAVSADGASLFVANAKGSQSRNPNSRDVKGWGQYGPNILEGTVSRIDLAEASANLGALTRVVLANNAAPASAKQPMFNPGIEHVFYIVKENRTYDQVFGDIAGGEGDPTLTLFGRDVTPNQHALAERFGLFDNFYVCAEVSADGWNWSTSGEANEYTQRNVPYNYSDRGRDYDFEGTNNGTPVDLIGRRDVAAGPGGYVWDSVMQTGKSVRNYGMFVSFGNDTKDPQGHPIAIDNAPVRKNLVSATCMDYRKFDMAFPDGNAEQELGLPRAPKETAQYGTHHDRSRFDSWYREFQQFVTLGNLPNLNLLRLPRNHTAGTAVGLPSPRAMVADNDYALGKIVDALSHSRYWKTSAIFVLEDDAQDGFDHVDCHRSPMLVISPYTRRGVGDGAFYNTDSVLATIERLLKAKPGNQYLAAAPILNVFEQPMNASPYSAVLPSPSIVGEINQKTAYRAKDSGRLSLLEEDSAPDFELNDILWRSVKGPSAKHPRTPGVIWNASGLEKNHILPRSSWLKPSTITPQPPTAVK